MPAARRARLAATLAIGGSTAAFAAACALPWWMRAGPLLLVDPLSAHVALLTAFVAMTAAWRERERSAIASALFLVLLAALLLAVLAGNLAVTWLALAVATIAGAVAIGHDGSTRSAGAAWTFFALAGVGLALALFGTVLLVLAAQPAPGAGPAAMRWSALAAAAPQARGPPLGVGFVFLLIGYGMSAALVPLHGWLADAEAQAPAPIAALLGGAMPTTALVAILRARALLAAHPSAIAPGPPLLALGLVALLFAGFSLWRQRDARRSLAFAGIWQSGMATFAFGLGGVAADFAGVLHLTLLTLTRVAAAPCRDGPARRPFRLTRAAGLAALAGMPPFGLFTSTFLIVSETARRLPWLLAPLGIGLVAGGWALAARLAAPAVPAPDPAPPPVATLVPAWLALALVLLFGLAMPGAVVAWLGDVTRALQ